MRSTAGELSSLGKWVMNEAEVGRTFLGELRLGETPRPTIIQFREAVAREHFGFRAAY